MTPTGLSGQIDEPPRFASAASRLSIAHQGPARGPAYDVWLEGICRGFCRLDVRPADSDFIDCRNEITRLHSITMATPRGTSARFVRSRELLQDGCDDLVLISASHGTVQVTQADRTVDLEAGEMCLTEMNVLGAAELSTAGGFTTLRLPRREVLRASPAAETRLARPLGRGAGLSAMIDRYLALCSDMAGELDPLGQKAAADHLIDLVGLLLGARADAAEAMRERSLQAARLELIQADILRNLERPNLSLERLARAHGLSERQAQRLFSRSGTTFSAFVLEQRLALARRIMDAGNWRKVSDIAYAAGFNDLSYFNRTFRRRFGATPSDFAPRSPRAPH